MITQHPPGPRSRLFGIEYLSKFRQDQQLQTYEDYARTYGDVVRVAFGGTERYIINDPVFAHQILVNETDKVCKSRAQKQVFGAFTGNGLINSDGDFWKRQRKLAQPAFHAKRIQAYVETMAAYTDKMLADWRIGGSYDIAQEMMQLTLSIVCDCLFSVNVREMAERIGAAVTVTQQLANRKLAAMLPLPLWFPTPQHAIERRAIHDLHALVMSFIASRRSTGEDRGDLLSMLLLAIDEDKAHGGGQMTDLQARDEAVTLLIVGHETSANALAWTLYELARHPQVEAQLRDELDRVLGGRAPTTQDIRQLSYLDQVIKESLRLHPPAWVITREAAADIQLGSYVIPKGSTIEICQHVMHRDARWFPDPLRFLPERFDAARESNLPKGAYLPFGTGPRYCIGQMFATMEMQVILAMVLQRYRLVLQSDAEIPPQPMVVQRPRGGVPMRVEVRQDVKAQVSA
jgi:cytochrome P450